MLTVNLLIRTDETVVSYDAVVKNRNCFGQIQKNYVGISQFCASRFDFSMILRSRLLDPHYWILQRFMIGSDFNTHYVPVDLSVSVLILIFIPPSILTKDDYSLL